MKNLQDFITERFNELDRGFVATPSNRENLEAFAKANQGSMDLVLMQMAIQFGYKMAMEDVQEILDSENEDQFEKEAREIENIENDN
jgi:hypothetical protein